MSSQHTHNSHHTNPDFFSHQGELFVFAPNQKKHRSVYLKSVVEDYKKLTGLRLQRTLRVAGFRIIFSHDVEIFILTEYRNASCKKSGRILNIFNSIVDPNKTICGK